MVVLKKMVSAFLKFTFIVCLFTPFTKAATMEIQKENTNYTIFASSRNCAFTIYLNDLKMMSNEDPVSVSTGFIIGQYLKPKNNKLKIEVYDPNSEPGKWNDGAKCSVYIAGANPIKEVGPEPITRIYFYPPQQLDLAKPEEFFRDMAPIDAKLGKSPNSPQISYSQETGRYSLTREFDVHENFIEWPWYRSLSLSNPLPSEHMMKLQNAYKHVWQALANKDITALRKVYHEMAYEGAIANDSTEESYFNSIDFDELFDDEFLNEFMLIPLDFTNKKLKFALDDKVVSMDPSPLLFCPKDNMGKNFDIDECETLNPRFRFDGKEFIISR